MNERLNRFFQKQLDFAMRDLISKVMDIAEHNPKATFLDLGCSHGEVMLQVNRKIQAKHLWGVEYGRTELVKQAEQKGIAVQYADLNKTIPFNDNSIDVIHAGQIIEHLHKPECFMGEIKRVLKPGGYAILSTENGASWHNVFALVMGWQMFSCTSFCKKNGCGNPWGLSRWYTAKEEDLGHIIIYTLYALIEFSQYMGFKVEWTFGTGYCPFPYWLGRIDKRHGHYIAVKVRKEGR